MKFSAEVSSRVKDPINAGSFHPSERDVTTGMATSDECGDVVQVQLKWDSDGKVADARFKTYGCAAAIASSQRVCELSMGKAVDGVQTISSDPIAAFLDLPEVKAHGATVAVEALRFALGDIGSADATKARR